MAESLPQAHVHHATLDDPIAEKALNNYLRTLDFDRTFFLAEEVGTFKQRATSLDDELRSGHIEFAYEVFAKFKDRAKERVAYVRNLLETEFDLTLDEDFTFKRKDEPWPQTAEERDDLWRKKIKNEYLGRKVAKALYEESPSDNPGEEDLDDEARDLLEKTPEEMVLKMHQQFLNVLEGHDAEWVLQAYLNAFTTAYDSHSSYLSPRATEDFDIAMKLSLTGIGAVLKYDADRRSGRDVLVPVSGLSPSARARRSRRTSCTGPYTSRYGSFAGKREPRLSSMSPRPQTPPELPSKKSIWSEILSTSKSDPPRRMFATFPATEREPQLNLAC